MAPREPQRAPARPVLWDASSGRRFILLFGAVSFFADLTYEGGRSIAGPFLGTLGASGLVVGVVAGLGELSGYALRLASGRWADRSRLYWPITLGGYVAQLPAVPALALAGLWPVAALLIVAERIGKAVRNPARNVMLAAAGEHVGQGWAFGLHEALDQAGALIGPLAIAFILAIRPSGYRLGFAVLTLPVIAALLLLLWLRLCYPAAGTVALPAEPVAGFRYPPQFWWYAAGAALIAGGFADYPLVSYHFAKAGTVPGLWVPVFYALAMGAGGLGALLCGKLFDRFGLIVLAPLTVPVAAYAPLAFLGGFTAALAGTLLWGVGLGAHESLMAAALATMIPPERRGTAYGLFMALFGAAWFVGSALQGALYDLSIPALVAAAVLAQLAGIVPILKAWRLQTQAEPGT